MRISRMALLANRQQKAVYCVLTEQSSRVPARKIRKDIYKLILPSVLQNILEIGITLLTTAIIGRLMADDISAKGICERIVQFDWALFRGLGTGAMLIFAHAYGAGLMEKCKKIAGQAYLICIPLALLFVAGVCLLPRTLLQMMADEEAVLSRAVPYLRILVLSSPFTAIMSVNTAIFNGRGDTKTPMYIAFAMNAANVVGCYLLVFGIGSFTGFGLIGSAYAVVISKGMAAALGVWLIYRKKGLFKDITSHANGLRPDTKVISEVFSGGLPVTAETLFWQVSTIVVSRAIFAYGSETYAAYLLGMQAETLLQAPTLGFSVAAMTLCSFAIAKKDDWLYRSYIRQLLYLSGIFALITTPLLLFGSTFFMQMLTDKAHLIPIGAGYISMMAIGQPALAVVPAINGILRAANHKKIPMVSTALGIWLVRVPIIALTAFVFRGSIYIVWLAISVDQIVRLSISGIFFLRKRIQHVISAAEQKDTV